MILLTESASRWLNSHCLFSGSQTGMTNRQNRLFSQGHAWWLWKPVFKPCKAPHFLCNSRQTTCLCSCISSRQQEVEEGVRAARLSCCSPGKGMGQQGQAVLSHGSWRKATTWGTHVQAAWESAVPPAVNLTSLPFEGGSKNSVLQKYGTRLFDLLVGLISNQLVLIIVCIPCFFSFGNLLYGKQSSGSVLLSQLWKAEQKSITTEFLKFADQISFLKCQTFAA